MYQSVYLLYMYMYMYVYKDVKSIEIYVLFHSHYLPSSICPCVHTVYMWVCVCVYYM